MKKHHVVSAATTAYSPQSIPLNEQVIWEQFRAGDRKALVWIYQQYHQILFQYGLQYLSDRGLIKDCIHDLFVNLQESSERLGPTDSIKFYLFRSLRRLLAKEAQKRQRFSDMAGSEMPLRFQLVESAENELIAQEMNSWQLNKLREAVNQLPERQREAIYYYFFQGFTYADIAGLLGFAKVKYARTLVYRALERLQTVLEGPENPHLQVVRLLGLLAATQAFWC